MNYGQKYVIGIDEVGRGCIAGPVAVGAVVCRTRRLPRRFYGIKDSKKLRPDEREQWFLQICEARTEGLVDFAVSFSGQSIIDKKGIVYAIRTALNRAITKLPVKPEFSAVLLDGGLVAPPQFLRQKTIIKGDEKEPLIAAASIVAKVVRDRKMVCLGREYPRYGFERHKGYGTRAHREAIQKHGTCPIHRESFLSGLKT